MDIGWYTHKFNELIKILDNVRNGCDTIPKWRVIKGNDDLMTIHLGYEAVKSIWYCDYLSALLFKKELEQAMKDYENALDTSADGACVFVYYHNAVIALPDYIKLLTVYHKFMDHLDETLKGKENENMDLNLKDNLVFGYEDAFNRIVEMVNDIMDVTACDDGEINIDYVLKQCKNFDEWTKTLHHPSEIWYKDITEKAVDCIRGYLVGFDMTHVFGNFMNTVTAHSRNNDIPKEAGSALRRLIHALWVFTYGNKLDFNSIETRTVYYDSDLYQKEALMTECGMLRRGDPEKRLLNGLMGLNGESGECIDILKKHLFQGHELDEEHLMEELGDVAWYLAVSADALGCKLSEIFEMNVKKLHKRYPDGFEVDKSVNREDD